MVVDTFGNTMLVLAPVIGVAMVAFWLLTGRTIADRLTKVTIKKVQQKKALRW